MNGTLMEKEVIPNLDALPQDIRRVIMATHKSSLYEDPCYFKIIENIPDSISLCPHEVPAAVGNSRIRERIAGSTRSLFRLAALRPDTLKEVAKGLVKEEELRTAYNSTVSLNLDVNIPLVFSKGPVMNYNSFMNKIIVKYYNEIITAPNEDVLVEVIGKESFHSNNLRAITKGMTMDPPMCTRFKSVGFEIENYPNSRLLIVAAPSMDFTLKDLMRLAGLERIFMAAEFLDHIRSKRILDPFFDCPLGFWPK